MATCPFCGKKLRIVPSGHDDGSVSVYCDDCGMTAGHYDNERRAGYVMGCRAMDADFLPCPLCGKEATVFISHSNWYILCRDCAMDMTSFVSRDDLKERWNRREG